ncbi:hypothetical protein [Idiomarina sp.]|uniref:hypothetical protein n=1 Tax=Idiomarina sp. TaxID=1874361 RepID=UPI00258F9479|nr:hypothetical protein [Idiomarina sp.]
MNEEQIEKESFDLCHALGIRNDEEQQWLSNYLKSTVGLDNAMVTYLVTGNKLWEQSTAHNDPREKRFKRIKSALTSRRNRKKKSKIKWLYRLGSNIAHDANLIDLWCPKVT